MLKALIIAASIPVMALAIYQLAQDYRSTQASKAYRKAVMEQAHTDYQARNERRRTRRADDVSPSVNPGDGWPTGSVSR